MYVIRQNRERAAETCKHQEYGKESQPAVKQQYPTYPSSPPSASSSPSHEFTFPTSLNSSTCTVPDNTKAASPLPVAKDVTPADDIFFHGHLLPLNLVSHFPVPSRTSNNSGGSPSPPSRESLDERQLSDRYCSSVSSNNLIDKCKNNLIHEPTKRRNTSKSLPQKLGLKGWHKGSEDVDNGSKKGEEKNKGNFTLEVGQVIKKYARLLKPLLSFKGRQENVHFDRRNYNPFSSGLSMKHKKHELRGRRGEYSAPVSLCASPANSGILVAAGTSTSASESTMEELQAAIQAAIAHCKNSVSVERKFK